MQTTSQWLVDLVELLLDDPNQSGLLTVFPLVAVERLETLKKLIPIRMRIALKPGFADVALRMLHAAGAGFDVASIGEIEQLLRALGLETLEGLDVCFTKPTLPRHVIAALKKYGVKEVAVEYTTDLELFTAEDKQWFHFSLRIGAILQEEGIHLSEKYGTNLFGTEAEIKFAKKWLKDAKKLGIQFSGIHFHPGSGMSNADQHAVNLRRVVVGALATLLEMDLVRGENFLVDIGGGPSCQLNLANWAAITQQEFQALGDRFPNLELELCAQFGSFFSNPSLLVGKVAGVSNNGQKTGTLEVSSGCYHALRDSHQVGVERNYFGDMALAIFEEGNLSFLTIHGSKEPKNGWKKITVYGASCDSTDKVGELYVNPADWRKLFAAVRDSSKEVIFLIPGTRAYGGPGSTGNFMGIPRALEIPLATVDRNFYGELQGLCQAHALQKNK